MEEQRARKNQDTFEEENERRYEEENVKKKG